nr:uncharacterized protein LOC117687222 [Crassostrea gigas]
MDSKRFDKTGEHSSKSSILCFKFDEDMQLPINFFHGIVLKCSKLNNWSILTEGARNNICLYQNAACFSFEKHVVVLYNCKLEIRVQVWASPTIYDGRLLKKIIHSVEDIIQEDGLLSYEIGYKCRKDVLNVEEDVSFISQSIFPVSKHVCETCDVDEKHEVDNDICWEHEIGVNEENQVVQRKNKFTVTDKLLQNHFGCLYTEIEPRKIAYEMLKTDHFSTTDYHDVAALPSRYTRLKRFLEILRRNHLHVPFYDTLKSLQHELLLEALRKDQPLGHKPSHYAMCIQCSFTILIKELPNDTLQMPLLDKLNLSDIEQLTSTERKKAKLLKILQLKGENACKKLYKTFSSFREGYDLKKTIENNISDAMTTKGRPDLIPCLKDLTISCLKDSKDFLMDELVPDPISDLLFEKRAIDIFTHDKLTETNRRRQQVKYLIETVQENRNDCFQFFLFILQKQSRFICEELQNPRRRTRRDD